LLRVRTQATENTGAQEQEMQDQKPDAENADLRVVTKGIPEATI